MHRVTIINNISEKDSHLTEIKELISIADEITLAVAFLKLSGLDLLIDNFRAARKRNAKITIVVGLDFGMTDPAAISELYKLLSDYTNGQLFLVQGTGYTFHPKIYVFSSRKSATIITGSANMTGGGLLKNEEISLRYDCTTEDAEYLKLKKIIYRMTNSPDAFPASPLAIERYKPFHAAQKKIRTTYIKQKINDSDKNAHLEINTNKLKLVFKDFIIDTENKRDLKLRQDSYRKARVILDAFTHNKRITKSEFINIYEQLVGGKGIHQLWHSGGLLRGKTSVFPNYKSFQQLVKYVRDNHHKHQQVVFDECLKFTNKIQGVGINVITELLASYDPMRYPILNNSPRSGLINFGCKIKTLQAFTGKDYKLYYDLMNDIKDILKLETFFEVDAFFNWYYWKFVKN